MDKNAVWKWLILLALVAGSLAILTTKKIRLGIDLKGGTSIVISIDEEAVRNDARARAEEGSTEEKITAEVNKILDGAQDRALEVLRNRIDGMGIDEPIIFPGKDNRIIIQLPGANAEKIKEAEKVIKSVAFLEFRMVHEENDRLVAALFDDNFAPEGYRIVRVASETFYEPAPGFSASAKDDAYRRRLAAFHVPNAAYEFMLMKDIKSNQTVYRPFFVKRRRELTGEHIRDASVDYQSLGQPVVDMEFDAEGTKKFAAVTEDYAPGGPKNLNGDKTWYLAIVLDGTLYSAPYIKEAIFGGRAEISGRFTLTEATFLANILKAGSLPAPVKIVEKRFIDPTLGKDSITSGFRAIIYGGVGVVLFMLFYYLLSGVVANLALVLNMILLPLGMIAAAGFLGIFAKDSPSAGPIELPVLTLPGIAGILLTIGMAVDANVLIFERIREESKAGKRLWTAILSGYDRAFVTIMDANVTTLITGVILFVFGSGPIRGFAVTLCAGIVVSMYTALVVTKLFFGVITKATSLKTLKMLSIVGNTAIDFIRKRVIAILLSLALIASTWTVMIVKGHNDSTKIFGVDFTGGSSITFKFEEKIPVESVRSTLSAAGISDANIQYQKEIGPAGKEFLQIKTGLTQIGTETATKTMSTALTKDFPNAGFSMLQEDDVGPQVGSELKRRAVASIVLALLGIIVYISIRFEFGFALGAIAALIHDVMVTIGVYSVCGRQISLPVVAALLTIVGYSVNDTIVVFDRIREDLRLNRNKSFREICNLSINQTLSRTLLTSLTTLIAVAMLLIFGGGAINDFALTLFVGVIVGTYSSIFIATPAVLLWHKDKRPEFATKGQ